MRERKCQHGLHDRSDARAIHVDAPDANGAQLARLAEVIEQAGIDEGGIEAVQDLGKALHHLPEGCDGLRKVVCTDPAAQVAGIVGDGLMRTDDEQLIYATYRGMIDGDPVEVPTATGASAVEGSYWRIVPIFETGSERYAWLNRIVCVGVGSAAEGGVDYAVYALR
ncbi:MAG: DUF3237 family protein [Gemmatimonas sp.]|nr:DUF3237 family protein [Gemmatimonas sp.]